MIILGALLIFLGIIFAGLSSDISGDMPVAGPIGVFVGIILAGLGGFVMSSGMI